MDNNQELLNQIKDPNLRREMEKAFAATRQDRFSKDVEGVLDVLSSKAKKLFGVEVMPIIDYTKRGTRSVVGVYKSKPVIKIHHRAVDVRPEFILKKAIPSEFSRLVAINLEKFYFERGSNIIKKIRKLLTGSEKEVNTTLPVKFKQYLYTCACDKHRWVRSEMHHRIQRREDKVKFHCNECDSDFWELYKEREITPEVLIRNSKNGLVAYTNGHKEVILVGGIDVDAFTDEVSKLGYKKDNILCIA